MTRFASTAHFLYDRPIQQVTAEVSKNLERALTLVRKCKCQSVLRRVVTIMSTTTTANHCVLCLHSRAMATLVSHRLRHCWESAARVWGFSGLVCLGGFRNLNTWLEAEKMKENFKIWKLSETIREAEREVGLGFLFLFLFWMGRADWIWVNCF